MNVFIDTNIYLNFFHLSNEDLEELRKIVVLQRNNRISLYLPYQTENEFKRNRENKILDALKRFERDNFNNEIPQMVKAYEEYLMLKDAITNFSKSKATILAKMKLDINNNNLKADQVISEIFQRSKKIEFNSEIFNEAELRHKHGNPPGKKDSIGDALNWELLLKEIKTESDFLDIEPVDKDLHIISDDGDYFSELENYQPKPFLYDEWKKKKGGELLTYRRISQFTARYFPDIKVAIELEKRINIEKLSKSGSYSKTHSVLAQLSNISDFTETEVNEIVSAYLTNSQVCWIIGDEDVLTFALDLIDKYESEIDSENLRSLIFLLPIVIDNSELKERVSSLKQRYIFETTSNLL